MSDRNPDRCPRVTLSAEQRQRTMTALEAVETGQATHATDLLDEWHAGPVWRDVQYLGDSPGSGPTDAAEPSTEWVTLDDVRGVEWELYDRFVERRLVKVFQLLLDGRFQPKYDWEKPGYIEVAGDLYVSFDGIHRTIACKVAGIERIHAYVEHYPEVATTPYRNWMGWPP